MRRPLHILIALQFLPCLLLAQLTVLVRSVSSNTPYEATIYLAGSFNGWEAAHPDYRLESNELGILELRMEPEPGTLAFKFTRGSWDTVEGTADGQFRPNRTYAYTGGPDTLEVSIEGWEGQATGGNSGTAAMNVSVISEDFFIPQFDRYRRIWIYLPPDYAISTRRYPVLYMHDGQNLFDRSTSFSGEWEVDESLNRLFSQGDPGIIVVGIDNGGNSRIEEYTPWPNPQYGGGEGKKHIDFIVETLKPYIDEHYRTLPDQETTGIMGSSLGGLISLYAGIEHQDIFGRVGVFSPSLWFSPQAYTQISDKGKDYDIRFYLMAGKPESTTMEADMIALYNNLLDAGFQPDELSLQLREEGEHSEWFWAREFVNAYRWLFAEETPTPVRETTIPMVTLSPNPAKQEIRIRGTQTLNQPNIQIFSIDGKVVMPPTILQGAAFNSAFLKPGTYLFIIRDGSQIVNTHKMIIAK
jgi:metallo-beta-lactamase class B